MILNIVYVSVINLQIFGVKMPTLEHVLRIHSQICLEARSIIEKKGHDYNREQQLTGNTLFNLTVCCLLGVVKTVTQGILVRLSDKMMRLISLTKDPTVQAEVEEESIRDTVKDMINYLVYLYIVYLEERTDDKDKASTVS